MNRIWKNYVLQLSFFFFLVILPFSKKSSCFVKRIGSGDRKRKKELATERNLSWQIMQIRNICICLAYLGCTNGRCKLESDGFAIAPCLDRLIDLTLPFVRIRIYTTFSLRFASCCKLKIPHYYL